MRAIRHLQSWRRLCGAAGSAVVVSMLASAAGARAEEVPDYQFHWAVRTRGDVKNKFGDLQAMIDLSGSPFQRDTILLYSSECGVFPHGGPHQVAMDPNWMAAHLDKLAFHMDKNVPDPEFSGLIVIDYEEWDLLWDRTHNWPSDKGPEADDDDFLDDWREYIQAEKPNLIKGKNDEQKEEVYRTTYEQAGRDFFEATFERIKELRPKAQVSFFKYPIKIYKSQETAPGVYGYGDGSYRASRLNDRLDWLWAMEDFIAPNIYCLYASVEDPVHENFENTADEDALYVRSNVTEAIRLAAGKPVIPIICYKYQRGDNPMSDWLLNQVNITNALCTPASVNAQGVILWGTLESEEQRSELEQYLYDYMAPAAASLDKDPGGDDGDGNTDPGDGDGHTDPGDGPGNDDGDGNPNDPFPTFELFDEAFNDGDMRADLNHDGSLNFFDYTAWQNAHANKDQQDKAGGGTVTISGSSKGRSAGVLSMGNGSRDGRGGPGHTRDGHRGGRPVSNLTPEEVKAALVRLRGEKPAKTTAGADADK